MMDFYKLVVEEHMKEILDAYKIGRITHEKAIEKINKASKYLYLNGNYRKQKEQTNRSNLKANKE